MGLLNTYHFPLSEGGSGGNFASTLLLLDFCILGIHQAKSFVVSVISVCLHLIRMYLCARDMGDILRANSVVCFESIEC